ncbi:hypothetical protein [Haloferax volcanii]|uniref:hypothetical protein n=1 Tax=Haloferax volcanii TaxID=2246 RepID=UPI00385C9B16
MNYFESLDPIEKLELGVNLLIIAVLSAYLVLLVGGIVEAYGGEFDASSFLGLFIPGTVTVIGSFYIYQRKESNNAEKLRTALRAELEQMQSLENLPNSWEENDIDPHSEKIPEKYMPPSAHVSTAIYESNVGNLGRLNNEEMKAIVDFYSVVIYVKEVMDIIHDGQDLPQKAHTTVHEYLKQYASVRQGLMDYLDGKKELSEIEWPDE